jgi:TfoX/Sxy family transcriptional regulator of competence genes
MKCLKNNETGNIIRIDDKQAEQMSGRTWSYVSKEEWKKTVRDVKTEKQIVEDEKKAETIAEKQLKRKKLKEKQS